MKRTEKPVYDFRCNRRLANAQSAMLQDNNPDAARVYEIHRKDAEKSSAVSYLDQN